MAWLWHSVEKPSLNSNARTCLLQLWIHELKNSDLRELEWFNFYNRSFPMSRLLWHCLKWNKCAGRGQRVYNNNDVRGTLDVIGSTKMHGWHGGNKKGRCFAYAVQRIEERSWTLNEVVRYEQSANMRLLVQQL